eukprot:CAMPEP_0117514774 /NCGR_PEP_ID=MMETSP0784-20121206/30240_1 /TAXON_ID=39447 /ORGANISM="" /LENGTH=425 /DNA_ID=CAMNT_0005310575 /DNA_START=208 /DNA_END=1482 /DNA_ORIENTATION=+
MVYVFAPVSGAHINPAISLAAALTRTAPYWMCAEYVVVQFIAGICGRWCCRFLYDDYPPLGNGFSDSNAVVLAEVIYTAVLIFVVLGVTSKRSNPDQNPNQFYGLAVGFVMIAAGSAVGHISGAVLNPAVSLGLGSSWGLTLKYALYQFLGGVIASLLFVFTHPEDYMREGAVRSYRPMLWVRFLSEFIGTFTIVLTFGLSVLGRSFSAMWAVAAIVMSMIYALGDVCGGHFNPAVTLAVVLCQKVDITMFQGLCYACAQILAAIAAAFVYATMSNGKTFPMEPRQNFTEEAAYVIEGLFTSLLALAVLNTAYARGIRTKLKRNYYFGLAVGAVVAAGGFASENVSGASFNPALSLGAAIVHAVYNKGHLYFGLGYFIVQLIGGALAVIFFAFLHVDAYMPPSPAPAQSAPSTPQGFVRVKDINT